ncbi:glycoside hydrolase family 3 [Lecanosticta acicola]|uniref:beta-glucosidase n=1 Tax=Lecanosticta acicola TaxID=111012 RepID=A0AAI9E668_9PEZI|nr:glycoside hydrolase family 3 [Lecanosticta acicola]
MHLLPTALLATIPLALAQSSTNSTLDNAQSPPKYPSPWGEGLGDWQDAYLKAKAFVEQLTLVEKVNLTTGVGWEGEKCVGNVGAIPRLGYRALCMQDSPLGVRFGDFASAFGAGVMAAATWDRKLFYERGYDMGTEHKLKGVDVQLGPVVGPIGRSPEGGRNWEGFSPDPVLSGIAVGETVKGIQDAGVIACTKHFIANEQEHFRQGPPPANLTAAISSNIDDVTMHELYLWPFADAVKAGTGSVMCSYNQINNSYACQNSYMLNYLLKNELGFQGFVMSDWGAQHSGVSAALAGMDMAMPGDVGFDSATSYWGTNMTIALLNGTIPQWRLDDMAVRIVATWYYVGRENNQVENAPNFSSWSQDTYGFQHFFAQEDFTQINYHVDVQQEHYQGIREVATKGTVLLKNNGVLPLTGKEKLTTVFGSDAAENQYGPNGCADRGCDNGTLAMGWGSGTANFPYLITPLEAIKAEVRGQRGNIESVTDDYAYSQISALAHRAGEVNGVCLVFANSDSGEGYIVVDGNEGDRNNLTLWHNGDTLIQNVTSQCNNTVVVMHTVGPVLVTPWYENPNVTAIVWAGIPGQESGNAITDILYGKANPGGKTPFTWGAKREDYGTDVIYTPNNGVNAPQDNFVEGIFIDYRAFDRANIKPIYEFGYGLSYTSFAFSNLQVQSNGIPAYTPTSGSTPPAPTYGVIGNNSAEYVFPANFSRVEAYIYPYLNSSSLGASSGDPEYGVSYSWPQGSYDSSPQPYLPAGGRAPGGNPALYDVLFTVTATVQNTGKVVGDEVPQLYVSLGGPNDPKVVLRNFDRLTIQPGASATFNATVTRRDLSNWDTASQNWVISSYPKTVYVGNSSRNLPLKAALNLSGSVSTPSGPSSEYPHPSGYGSPGNGSDGW